VVKDNRLIVSDWGNHHKCKYIEGSPDIMHFIFERVLDLCGGKQ
jgi:hypothetical protein